MKRLSLLIGLGIGTLSFFGSVGFSHAASPVCGLQDGLQKFVAARESEGVSLQLDARKGLLFIVTDCTKEETQSAIKSLESLTINDNELTTAKEQLLGNLNQELTYADGQKSRINDVGLLGTRDLARTLKEWRLNIHLPQTGNANNFTLWAKNESLLEVAKTRAHQIDQTLHTLKLSDRDEIKQYVEEANRELADASTANENARGSLIRLENPDTTARLLRTSFNSLSAAYSSFLKVSDEVKKILPF